MCDAIEQGKEKTLEEVIKRGTDGGWREARRDRRGGREEPRLDGIHAWAVRA